MDALEDEVLGAVDLLDALAGGGAPGHEDDAAGAALRDDLDGALRQALPAAVGVGVGLVGAHRQAGVEQEDAAVGPGRQEPAVLGRRLERPRVVSLQRLVHVAQGRRGRRRRPHAEGQAVRLVHVVVRVLA